MKNTKRFLSTLLIGIFLCVCFVFASCAPNLAGTYKFKSMTVGEETIVVGESYYGLSLSEDFVVITLNEDGTASLKSMGTMQEGTWEKADGGVKIIISGDAQFCTCDGETLVMEESGMTLTLEK